MKLTPELMEEIKAYAKSCYPNECCGLVVDGKFEPTPNVSPEPTKSFLIKPSVYNKAVLSGKLEALIHSHCVCITDKYEYDPRWPTTKDMETWIKTNIAWGVLATDGTDASDLIWMDDNDTAPLLEREFIHGIHDCYSVVRDYYRTQLNIKLLNVARVMGWWDKGKNLYEENFARAGFYEITEAEADVNDICLFQVRSQVINHAAVITGNNEILHHLFHRLSEHDRLDRWRRYIVKYIRYNPELDTSLNTLLKDKNNVKKRTSARDSV